MRYDTLVEYGLFSIILLVILDAYLPRLIIVIVAAVILYLLVMYYGYQYTQENDVDVGELLGKSTEEADDYD